ncbi:uncharacterized protein ARMOST_06071 [Armillaria ostoyae]|uniref:Heterokaryon incompatibility domain-containing protein n=1 Tax=Armillaria ostoyae TaxID=47428 RepID=A0A284R228_ARMOS|nr:uncharacterized protein ARMOST_06071 [Armillaria ostoyae]
MASFLINSRKSWKGLWGKHNNSSHVPNEGRPQPDPILPEIILSGCEESGQNDISIVLPLPGQRSYTDDKPVIKSSLANTPCFKLGVNELLEKLNSTLGTSYILEILSESLQSALRSCVERRDYDFGTAYARLRPYWFEPYEPASRYIVEDERNDQDMRNQWLTNKRISNWDAPPRRVWDLYANRVVPYWVVRKYPWAISHAWVYYEELKYVMTPINQNEWPVPIPKDANLDLIRIEMLNLEAEYVWLDVLCMRQKVGKQQQQELRKRQELREERIYGQEKHDEELRRTLSSGYSAPEAFRAENILPSYSAHVQEVYLDNIRLEEWKVDVPTIGWVYRKADQVVCYFSGLGRPLTTVDLVSDRSWFKRAWTLQEMNIDPIVGGMIGPEVPAELHTQLESLRQMRRDDFVFDILIQMRTRKSTNPVDRVAALVYLFHSEYIPIYDEDQSEEDAWTALVNITQDWFRADLFFFYPKPGDGKQVWRPSWNQAMKHTVSWRDPSQVMGKIQWVGEDGDWYRGPYIESCEVRGLGNASDASAQRKLRRGELCLKDSNGETHTFKIIADHTYPISDGTYTLIGSTGFPSTQSALLWVVGKMKDGKFEKLSVFSMADDRAGARLQRLGVAELRKVYLI